MPNGSPAKADAAASTAAVPAVPGPSTSAAPDDAELARRRLEALREEMAGYEREAERLRVLLRRALGLDSSAEPEPGNPPAGEPEVRDAAR